MRNGLYMLRHSNRLTQEQMAEKIGCSRNTYAPIENGVYNGGLSFWLKLQAAFDIPDADMFALMRNDE